MTHHKCHIATARIGYRGCADERVLDTTVKSGMGLGAVFAPTWKLVMGVKRGELSWSAYVEGYTALMRDRYRENQAAFLEALNSEKLIDRVLLLQRHARDDAPLPSLSARRYSRKGGDAAQHRLRVCR